MSWRLLILELYKLFSKKKEYSLRNLFLNIKAGGFPGMATEADLNKWGNKLDENMEMISKLRNQRNKLIAHQDRDGLDGEANGISIIDIRTLIVLIQEVVKSIYFIVTGFSLIVDNLINAPVDELDKIITLQVKDRREKLIPTIEEAKKYELDEFGGDLPKTNTFKAVCPI